MNRRECIEALKAQKCSAEERSYTYFAEVLQYAIDELEKLERSDLILRGLNGELDDPGK